MFSWIWIRRNSFSILHLTHGYSEFKQEISVYPYTWIHSVVCLYVIHQINRLRHIQVNDIIHFLAQSIISLVIVKKSTNTYLWKKKICCARYFGLFYLLLSKLHAIHLNISFVLLVKNCTHNFTENIWKYEFPLPELPM